MNTKPHRRAQTPVIVPIAVHGLVVVAVGLLVPLLLRSGAVPNADQQTPVAAVHAEQEVARVIASEELILRYTPQLGQLAKSFMNLRLPDFRSGHLFADEVEIVGQPASQLGGDVETLGTVCVDTFHWPLDETVHSASRADIRLWDALLDDVQFVEHAKFYFVSGELSDSQPLQWTTHNGFSALVRLNDGRRRSLSGKIKLTWRPRPASDSADPPPTETPLEGSGSKVRGAVTSQAATDSSASSSADDQATEVAWEIVRWETEKIDCQDGAQPLYAEVLDAALPRTADRRRAQESISDQLVIRAVRDPNFVPPTKYFDQYAFDRHPGVTVVDVDRDGWDDIYAMDRWGRNLFLRNRGDGTFTDIAAEVGLDLEDFCCCALFADFDNDGDDDVFIGRTLARSRYYENDSGKFVDRSESHVAAELPFFVSSLAAADYNGDGLLDVYFATYAADTIDKEIESRGGLETLLKSGRQQGLLEEFLSPADARELLRRQRDARLFTSRVGPPNVLLVNRGGRFEVDTQNSLLRVWRNTYQATWADYDNDGDADLYVANDFSPNNLFRNEGGQFVDVTLETGTADIGFGMGAAWGDYDNDGRQDLYVSNMFSKAGRRIAGAMRNLVDPTFVKMAGGNSLFRNEGQRFKKVSGLEPPSLLVEKVGWAWGGQFLDVDNDGYLDIYATSGYYTAPQEIAVQVDL